MVCRMYIVCLVNVVRDGDHLTIVFSTASKALQQTISTFAYDQYPL